MTAEHPFSDDDRDVPSAGTTRDYWRATGGDLDPQLIVSAAIALAHSDDEVHCGLSVTCVGMAPETVAATDDVPVRVDWLQHVWRQGPGVDRARDTLLVSRALATDPRWPDFGKMCLAVLNLRSMVSISIPVPGADRASLNFYATSARALDHLDMPAAMKLAQLAIPSVGNVLRGSREAHREAGQHDHSRLAVALGIVMGRYRISSARAFDLLLQASRELDRPLLDVAVDVARDGRLPDEAVNRRRHERRDDSPRGPGGTSLLTTQAWVRNGADQAWVDRQAGVTRSDGRGSHALLSDAGPVPGVQ